MQARHRGHDHRVAQRRLADQHVVGRTVAVAAIDAEAGRGVALGIEIDNQHAFANRSECGTEIDRCGSFSDSTLLVGERQDPRMAGRMWRPILLINFVNYGHCALPFVTWGSVASLDAVEFDDPASSARDAGMKFGLYIPIFSGFGQFGIYILTLEKQRFRALSYRRFREADKLM